MTLTLTVNGESRRVEQVRSVRDMVVQFGLGDAAVAVEVNRQVVPRKQHEQTPLQDGDVIELVTLVGAG